jgi:hypothetical protein
MNRHHPMCVTLSTLVAGASLAAPAAAQTSEGQGGGNVAGTVLGIALLIALFLIIGITVKVFDRRRRRMEEAVAVQARIADALLVEPVVRHLPIATTANRAIWRGSPVTIEVRGPVPSPEARNVALGVVMREATASGMPFRIDDRLIVDPVMAEHPAEVALR